MSVDVVVVGETLVDVVRRRDGSVSRHPGGSCANVAVALARLERRVGLRTQIGYDPAGLMLGGWLAECGVEVLDGSVSQVPTSHATAVLGDDGSATYDFDLVWSPGALELPTAGVVHTGSIAAVVEPGARAVRQALLAARDHAVVTYDPNIRPALTPDRTTTLVAVESLVGVADVVKVSAEDLDWLHPGRDVAAVARDWVEAGPALVVVTDGGRGAVAFTAHGRRLWIPPVRVEVVDTVGAGDTFMGALIDGLIAAGVEGPEGWDRLVETSDESLRAVLSRCAAAAAVTVSRAGADSPSLAELGS